MQIRRLNIVMIADIPTGDRDAFQAYLADPDRLGSRRRLDDVALRPHVIDMVDVEPSGG